MNRDMFEYNKYMDQNRLVFIDYYTRLSLLAKSIFKWKNLPKEISERFLERVLFQEGKIVFFKDDTLGYMISRYSETGRLNYYEEPTIVRTANINYPNRPISIDKCVLIRNNVEEMPTSWTIRLFANKLSNVERTREVNMNSQKTPIVILCNESEKMSVKALYDKYDGNAPIIIGDKSMGTTLESLKAIKTEAPYLVDKLTKEKHELWNEAMTFLGVNNSNTDKKERLVTDEVNSNNEMIMLSAEVMLSERKKACKMINEMFDLDIDVEFRDFKEYENLTKEGDNNV